MHSNAQMHPSNADSSTLSVFLGLCVISGEGFCFFLGEQQRYHEYFYSGSWEFRF